MNERQHQAPTAQKAGAEKKTSKLWRSGRYAAAVAVVGGVSLLAGFQTARKTIPVRQLESVAAVQSAAGVSTPAPIPAAEKNENAEFSQLPPQQQAEHLLERAIRDDQRSLNLLRENVDGWRGHLKNTDRLFDLVLGALNSSDLHVRTAAIDVDLAANNLSKTPESLSRLLREIQEDPASRGMALWRLGSLGNRGVEPEKVLNNLLNYSRSQSEHTRYWAAEGLAMLGNDATIDPLLNLMAHDPSRRVRELAASSLAQSGMLTREERLAAVPHLLNLADDDSLGPATRELVFGTLRVITRAELGNNASAWRAWWANHDPAKGRPRERDHAVRT